jgi:hypothetical protein
LTIIMRPSISVEMALAFDDLAGVSKNFAAFWLSIRTLEGLA